MKEVTYEDWQKNPTPRMMWVWDGDEVAKKRRKVIYFLGPKAPYPVAALTGDETITVHFKHCAEIEEPKTRRMTNQELAWWLREKPTREYKCEYRIGIYYEYVYTDEGADEDIVIRENGGEWKEPLVEVKE